MLVRTVGGDDATVTDPHATRTTPSVLLAPGSLLAGRYRIERFLAAGGMGEVHEVLDEVLGERVAVKLLREDLSDKREAQARFTDEIRLARQRATRWRRPALARRAAPGSFSPLGRRHPRLPRHRTECAPTVGRPRRARPGAQLTLGPR